MIKIDLYYQLCLSKNYALHPTDRFKGSLSLVDQDNGLIVYIFLAGL